MENAIIKILENKQLQLKKESLNNWSVGSLNKLIDLLEYEDVYVSDHLYDLLLFNISNITINKELNTLSYTSKYKPSKKVNGFLNKHKQFIIDNIDLIFYSSTYNGTESPILNN